MAYEKLGFENGQVLEAEHLNHMEDGIANAIQYTAQNLSEKQQEQTRKNIGAVDKTDVEKAINDALGKADLNEYELLGQTPQYLPNENAIYNVVLEVNEQTTVSIISDTVGELAGASNVQYVGCEETVEDGVYILECKSTGAWYQVKKSFIITGLTPGEKYNLMYDVTGVVQSDTIVDDNYAHLMIADASGKTLITKAIHTTGDIKKFPFTSNDERVTVNLYTTSGYYDNAVGNKIRYRDIWINRESAKKVRTDVYNWNGTVSEQLELNGIKGGVTIESTPITNVYTKIVAGEENNGYLKGKKCVCFGDSITGNYTSPLDYPSFIANKTGMEVINGGFGGCRMANHPYTGYNAFSMHSLADSIASGDWSLQDGALSSVTSQNAAEHLESLKNMDWNTVDYITIFYGTNDFTGGVSIDSTDNPMSTGTYKGAFRHSVEAILTAYPHIRIVVITPIYRFWKEDETVTDSDVYEIVGSKLTDFVKAAVEVADEYKVPVFNLYNSLGINKLNCTKYLADGVHPSDAGIERIGESIAARLIAI